VIGVDPALISQMSRATVFAANAKAASFVKVLLLV
jgi:hypothetical protein